jgi:hypothetical protein
MYTTRIYLDKAEPLPETHETNTKHQQKVELNLLIHQKNEHHFQLIHHCMCIFQFLVCIGVGMIKCLFNVKCLRVDAASKRGNRRAREESEKERAREEKPAREIGGAARRKGKRARGIATAAGAADHHE